MAQHHDLLSPKLDGWTPAPEDEAPETAQAISAAYRFTLPPAGKAVQRSGIPPLPLRAASGTASSPGAVVREPNLIAPFKERCSSAHAAAATVSGAHNAANRKVVQPPMQHGSTHGKPRPAPPPGKLPSQFVPTTTSSSSSCNMDASSSGTSSRSNSGNSSKHAQIQQPPSTSSRGHSSRSASRPDSRHAAAQVAAAEAAVAEAAAVLQHHKPPAAELGPANNVAPHAKHAEPASPAQKLLRSKKHPIKGSTTTNINPFSNPESSTHVPLNSSNGRKLQLKLDDQMQVQGVSPRFVCSKQQPASIAADNATPTSAEHQQASESIQETSECTAALQRLAAGLRYQQPTAAEILAFKAKSRRLRIQWQSLHASCGSVKDIVRPRPASPPAVTLDGALLLASCQEGLEPADVLFADLNAANIGSIALPQTIHSQQVAQAAPAGDSAPIQRLSLTETAAGADASDRQPALPAAAVADEAPQAQEQCLLLQNFSQLCSLDLSDNRLTCIAGLAWLPALQQLAVSANRLHGLQGMAQVLGVAPTADQQLSEPKKQGEDRSGEQQSSSTTPSDSSKRSSLVSSRTSVTENVQQDQPEQGVLSQPSKVDVNKGLVGEQPLLPLCLGGFGCLRELDLSFNLVPGTDLLGDQSPLAQLPKLCTLHAAGNSLLKLPDILGPFTSLTYLDLSHNRLGGAAMVSLGQLPALQHLLLGNNPIRKAPDALSTSSTTNGINCSSTEPSMTATTATTMASTSTDCTASSVVDHATFRRLRILDLGQTKVGLAKHLMSLLTLPQLTALNLVGTPLAARCWQGRGPVQELEKPGLTVITYQEEPQAVWQHSTKTTPAQKQRQQKKQQKTVSGSKANPSRLLPVTIGDDAMSCHVLATAGRNAILGLQHQQLVAAFERVGQDIDNWQLAPVAEEASAEMIDDQAAIEQELQQSHVGGQFGGKHKKKAEDEEPVVDQTFLTGVGITAELPGDDEQEEPTVCKATGDEFQDPTERLAIGLGLPVCQLAHYTHRQISNPLPAIHRLRHALAHPLVDADVGQHPPQHHTSMTVATAAKQRPRQLLPLPQPIPRNLDTRVKAVQNIENVLLGMRSRLQELEGTLLQQLQAQSDKLSAAAQTMHINASAEAATAAVAAAVREMVAVEPERTAASTEDHSQEALSLCVSLADTMAE